MSLLETDYNSGGSSNNNSGDGDYEERDSLKLSNYAIVSGEVSRLAEYTGSQFGQNLILDLDDVQVIDGLVYDRHKGDDDDTMKVFGYDKWFKTDENGALDEEVEEKLINHRTTESFGGTDYPYEFVDRTEEGDETLPLGNMTMWLSNSTKFRTMAKVLTPQGHDVIDDKDDDYNWLATEDPQLRTDLKGRRIILFFKEESFIPDDKQDAENPEEHRITYTDAAILDEDTGAGITIQNGSSDSSTSTDDSDDDAESGSLGGDGGLPDGVPDAADQILDFAAQTGETDGANIESLVAGEVDDGVDYDVEACVAEVERRMD